MSSDGRRSSSAAVAPRAALAIAWTMFALAAVLGLALGALVDWRVVGIGAACMAIGVLYSAGPFAIARLRSVKGSRAGCSASC